MDSEAKPPGRIPRHILRQQRREAARVGHEHLQRTLAKEGWLLGLIIKADHFLFEYVSLISWLTRLNPAWFGSISLVETYVVGWAGLELALLLALAFLPSLVVQAAFVIAASVLLLYRWTNIMSYWVHGHLLYRQTSSAVRALVLSVINLFELVLIFSVLDYLARDSFSPALSHVITSFYYTVRTVTLIGSEVYNPVAPVGYVLFCVQAFTGIGFLAIVVTLVIGYFSNDRAQ